MSDNIGAAAIPCIQGDAVDVFIALGTGDPDDDTVFANWDVTGWPAQLHIRTEAPSSALIFEGATDTDYISIQTWNVEGDDLIGWRLEIPTDVTDDFPLGDHVWDLRIVPAGDISKAVHVVGGPFPVTLPVTRIATPS